MNYELSWGEKKTKEDRETSFLRFPMWPGIVPFNKLSSSSLKMRHGTQVLDYRIIAEDKLTKDSGKFPVKRLPVRHLAD